MSRPASPNSTRVDRTELAEVISQNAKNNFSKVLGLTYFCGGPERYAANPQLLCATSIIEWLKDIDARTAVQWDDAGRVQLCKQYALGPVFNAVANAIRVYGNDWAKVKEDLILVYPDTKTFETKRTELGAIRRRTGETLSELYTRIRSMALLLTEEKPAIEETLKRDAVSTFLHALPVNFQGKLVDTDYTNPAEVYSKAVKYARFHPQAKLDDEQVRKEHKQTVAMVASPPRATPLNMPPPLISQAHQPPAQCGLRSSSHTGRGGPVPNNPPGSSGTCCYRCGYPGHIARFCRAPVCSRCGEVGHAASQCRRPSNPGRGNPPRMWHRNPGNPGWTQTNSQGWRQPQHSGYGHMQGKKNSQRRGN